MNHYTYLGWLFALAILPSLLVWAFKWRQLIVYRKVFLYCFMGSVLFATPWDYWATHSWLWHFSPDRTVNVHFLGLPLEEYVFFISYTFLYASLALVLRNRYINGGDK